MGSRRVCTGEGASGGSGGGVVPAKGSKPRRRSSPEDPDGPEDPEVPGIPEVSEIPEEPEVPGPPGEARKARDKAESTASRTTEAARKRTSRFVGWTFTSTASGGKSMKRKTTGLRPASSRGYASRTAAWTTGAVAGRPFTKTNCPAVSPRVLAGTPAQPETRTSPSAPDTGTNASR